MAGDQKKFQTAMTHAKRFADQGNWADASKAYRYALAEFPNDRGAVLGFGQASLAGGQVEIAYRAFQQALKLDPTNQQALYQMAEIQEQLGRAGAAAETYLRLGNISSGQSDLETAIAAWEQTVRLLPDHVDAHTNLVQALIQQDQTRPAARQLLTLAAVYQHKNENESAWHQIEKAKELIGEDQGLAAAIEALKQGTPIQPDLIGDTPAEESLDDLDPFGLSDFGDAFEEKTVFAGGDDPFDLGEELDENPKGGLIETVQQNAMAELANVIFEDDDGANTPVGTMSRDEVNMRIIQAIDQQSRGDLSAAIGTYQQVIKAGAARPAVYFNLGLLYKQHNQHGEATKMLQVSAQNEKYRIASHLALGETYHTVNDLETAIRHFVEAVKLVDLKTVSNYKARDLLQYYETLADNYIQEGDLNKISSFIKTLGSFFSKPTWETRVYQARQRIDNVADNGDVMSLAEFLETPETEIVVTALAVTAEYIKRNRLMTASEECLRAIQRAPSYLRLHARQAEILLKQNQTDQAITKYLYIAKVYRMRNQPDQAISIYQRILQLAPMDVTVRSQLIDLYTSRYELDRALEEYLVLADSYYQLAQVDRAIEKYNEALRLAANEPNAVNWRIKILGQLGDIYNQRFDWARATSAFEELLELTPDNERIQRQIVDLYFKQGKSEQAIKILDNLLALYEEQKQSQKSLELLKEFASSYPDSMPLRQRLAVIFSKNGMRKEAMTEYDALGEMQLEHGLRDQAVKTIQAILALGPDDAEGYRRLLAQISGGPA